MKEVINKESFVTVIDGMKQMTDYEDEFNAFFLNHHEDGYHFPEVVWRFVDKVICMLTEIFEDDEDWISYFCFDLNFGDDYNSGCVVDENGKYVDLSDADKLYDFLLEMLNEKYDGGTG